MCLHVGNMCDLKVSLNDFYAPSAPEEHSSGKVRLLSTHDQTAKQISLLDTRHQKIKLKLTMLNHWHIICLN